MRDKKKRESAVTPQADTEEPVTPEALPFPVTCIGASAGGLEAFGALLRSLPANTGMAFVLVSHLPPDHASALAELLSRATEMPVA